MSDAPTVTNHLLEWAMDHERQFRAIAAITTVVFGTITFFIGFAGGRIVEFRRWRRERQDHRLMQNPSIVVFEGHVLREKTDGSISLKVISWGGKRSLSKILHDPILEEKVEMIARRREGFIVMEPRDQLLLMDGLQEEIVGNDSSANLDALKCRLSNSDTAIMCPVTWPGLREATVIRGIIIDDECIEGLKEKSVIDRIIADRPRYQHRAKWLHEIALRWQDEKNKPEEERCMRLVEIESQRIK